GGLDRRNGDLKLPEVGHGDSEDLGVELLEEAGQLLVDVERLQAGWRIGDERVVSRRRDIGDLPPGGEKARDVALVLHVCEGVLGVEDDWSLLRIRGEESAEVP